MCTPCSTQGSEIVRGLQTPLRNRNCISISKHWYQAGWHQSKFSLYIWSFQVSFLALQPSAMLQALQPKKREIYKQFASLYAAPTIKLKEVKKITKSRPLPEGHTPDLHNMLIKVFQPQKDIHNLVSISEWCLHDFFMLAEVFSAHWIAQWINQPWEAEGFVRTPGKPYRYMYIPFSPLDLSCHHPTQI